ncbi:MAG: flagellar hook-associated protein FlgK [Herbinix sp.]|nr:flagellar hook-associated protein FlgK [Herbinix sp.]
MSSTFFGLNIGKSGLYAYQSALDTTSHNITNAETEGYSRQIMGQQASKALQVNSTYGMAGTGVSITGVTQQREEYYDNKYRTNNTIYGEYSGKSHYMTEIENYFNDVSVDGFTTSYNSFNDSLQELQKNPSSLTVRTQVANYAESLTEYFNSLSVNLSSIQEECNFEIRNQVDQINSTSQQIAALTQQINTLEVNGGTANDLRDQRALLVDELSEIANVTVSEKTVGIGAGVTNYVVKLNGDTLVDGSDNNTLKVVPREKKVNQNDVDGLYDIIWENGQEFNTRSQSLGGTLQGLLEVRDGNNQYNFNGTISANAGDTKVTVTDTNMNMIELLNIPETGLLTVGNREYAYSGFEVTTDAATGNFIYEFALEDQVAVDVAEEKASIGDSINYKGIPYYMNQLNQFTRTYAKAFNDIHRTGVDLDGDAGTDFFTSTSKVNGRNYTFGPLAGSEDEADYDYDTFNSQTGSYYEEISENEPLYGSYYFMTAANFTINKDLIKDPSLMATSTDVLNGSESNDVVDKLLALKGNKMLFQQGSADGFFQTLVAEIGIDTSKAATFSDSQTNILDTIKNQRLSISGVDVDEEAMNLVRYQNAYNLSAKVISVMDEIYDKLINYMGV